MLLKIKHTSQEPLGHFVTGYLRSRNIQKKINSSTFNFSVWSQSVTGILQPYPNCMLPQDRRGTQDFQIKIFWASKTTVYLENIFGCYWDLSYEIKPVFKISKTLGCSLLNMLSCYWEVYIHSHWTLVIEKLPFYFMRFYDCTFLIAQIFNHISFVLSHAWVFVCICVSAREAC